MKTSAEIRRSNLISIIDQSGLLNKEIAAKIGITSGYLSQIKMGPTNGGRNIGNKVARRIEECLELPSGWLDKPRQIEEPKRVYYSNNRKNSFVLVPVLNWSLPTNVSFDGAFLDHLDTRIRIHCPVSHTSDTVAFKVEDSAMESTTKHSFPRDTIIYFDLQSREPRWIDNNDFVLAFTPKKRKLLFRQFKKTTKTEKLVALNSSYNDISSDFNVIGRLLGSFHHY